MPAAKTLTKHGVHNVTLLTPVVVTCAEGRKVSTVGSLPLADGIRRLSVEATPQAAKGLGIVEVQLEAELLELRKGGSSQVFELSTTIAIMPGEYMVIGASPVSGDVAKALALILRVDARE